MIRAAAIVALVAAPSAFAFGMWSGQNTTTVAPVTAVRQNAPLVAKPGWGVDGAAKYLAKLNPPPPPPPPPPKILPPPPPPPPDVGLVLRRDVSAVMTGEAGGPPRLVLTGRRTLRLGDTYADGWTLTNVSSQVATLTKGKDVRQVNLFTPAPGGGLQAQGPAPASLFSFTNGQRPGAMSAAQVAQLIAMARRAGLPENQINQLTQTLQSGGTPTPQMIIPLLMAMGRNGAVRPQELNQFLDSLSRSGLMPAPQAQAIGQQLASQTQANQMNQINQMVQQMNRGGGNQVFPGGVPPPLPGGQPYVAGFGQPNVNANNNNNRGGGNGGNRGGGAPRPPNAGFNSPAAPTAPVRAPPPPPGPPAPPPPVTIR